MYDSSKKSRYGGKRDFSKPRAGGFKSYGDRDGRSSGPMTLHDAICAECGNECKVPFKPNGKKPVFCGDCFRKSEGGSDRGERKPSYGSRPQGHSSSQSNDGPALAELNRKVDRILRILEDAE